MHKAFPIILQILIATFGTANAFAGGTVFLNDQGKDPRQDMSSTEMPWSSIGFVTAATSARAMLENTCTGTLIDKHLVLTAAHCVVNEQDDPKKNTLFKYVTFQPNLKKGKSVDKSISTQVIVGTMDPSDNGGNDWAIIVLKDDLGTKYGTMDVSSTSNLSLPMTVQFSGYSADYKNGDTAGMVDSCQIIDTAEEGPNFNSVTVFNHSCSAMEGSSGGPLFHLENGRYTIAAVHIQGGVDDNGNEGSIQGYSDELGNVGVMTDKLIRAVQNARTTYEK